MAFDYRTRESGTRGKLKVLRCWFATPAAREEVRTVGGIDAPECIVS